MRYKELLQTIANFKTDYSTTVSDHLIRFRGLTIRALEVFTKKIRPDFLYESHFKPHVDKLIDISELCCHKEIFGSLYSNILTFLPLDKLESSKINNEMEYVYNELRGCLNEIEELVASKEQEILDNINKAYCGIRGCQYGTNENRKKNANDFEQYVVELFCWLFLGEVELLEPGKSQEHHSIIKRKLQRDAMFEVNKNINVDSVINYNFLHFIIECKNFAKPNYPALLQAYAYMIFERMLLHDDNKTLCVIMSRENPDDCDVTIKMRDRLCEVNKNLMIIFMSDNDVGNMVKERIGNKKPAKIIYDCIRNAKRQSKTGEYY